MQTNQFINNNSTIFYFFHSFFGNCCYDKLVEVSRNIMSDSTILSVVKQENINQILHT